MINLTLKPKKEKVGRKPIYEKNAEYLKILSDLYMQGKRPSEMSKILNVSIPTIYRWLKQMGLLKSKEEALRVYLDEIELNGFTRVPEASLARRIARKVPNSRIIKLNTGVGMEGRKFSSVSFFGMRPFTLVFVVKDENAFKEHAARLLEGMFYEANPNPDPHLKKAFTHFIHSFGLSKVFQDSPFKKAGFYY